MNPTLPIAQMKAAADLAAVLSILQRIVPRHREYELQSAIRNALTLARVPHEAEFRLDKQNRLDFYVVTAGGLRIAIETKTTGARAAETERQLRRYALTGQIDELILVCTKPQRVTITEAPDQNGRTVPVHVVSLAFNAL